jgi:hypothetical protein
MQAAIRRELPRAFRRNYRLESTGAANVEQTLDYIASQPLRHQADTPLAQHQIADRQLCDPEVDLTAIRYSAHGQFIHNLHLTVELPPDACKFDIAALDVVRQMLRKMCSKHSWSLGHAGLVADHIHLGLGCGIDEAPQDVALAVLNNLAFAFGMRPLFRFSYYVGTFGPFNRGAICHARLTGPSPADPAPMVNCLVATPRKNVLESELLSDAEWQQSVGKQGVTDAAPSSVAIRHFTTDAGSVGEEVAAHD